MRTLSAAIITWILMTHGISAESWPQWRGPLGNGVSSETDLPVRWSQEDVAWKTPLKGLGASSPILWGDRVFVTSQLGTGVRRPGSHPTLARGDDAEIEKALARRGSARAEEGEKVYFLVEAFHRSSGDLLWEYRFPAEGNLAPVHEKSNLANASPVTDGEMVYAWFGTGQLVALTTDGKLVWQRHLGQEISPFSISWGHGSSPALYQDSLYLLCYHEPASYLLALDKKTGREKWRVNRGENVRSYSTPTIVQGSQGTELIVNSSERIDAYDPASGKHLWYTGEGNRFPIPVPAFDSGVLYASRGYRSGPYMAILTGGRGEISGTHVRWSVPTGAPYVSSLVYYQGLIYMATDAGIATCVDASTGERVWQERVGGIFSASPVAGDGKVYFLSETGEVIVLQAGRELRILARNQMGERIMASPAISGGRLFIRTDENLFSIGK